MAAAPGGALAAGVDDDLHVFRHAVFAEVVEAQEHDVERQAGEGLDEFVVVVAAHEMAGGDPGAEISPGGEDGDLEGGGVGPAGGVERFEQAEFLGEAGDVVLEIGEGLDEREVAAEADAIDGRAQDAAAGVDPEILRVEGGVAARLEGGLALEAGGEEIRVEAQLVGGDALGVGAEADLEGVEDALDEAVEAELGEARAVGLHADPVVVVEDVGLF